MTEYVLKRPGRRPVALLRTVFGPRTIGEYDYQYFGGKNFIPNVLIPAFEKPNYSMPKDW